MRIVELGFGNGEFARWSIDSGHEYIGVELIEELLNSAREAGLNVAASIEEVEGVIEAGSVDLIVALDVLEHLTLEQVVHHLAVMRRLLRGGGTLLARVPSGDSPFGRGILHGDLTHCSVLGSSAVRQLAQRCGYETVRIDSPAFPVLGLGFRRMVRRAIVRCSRWMIARVINAVFHDNQPLVITSNMVFVLRKATTGSNLHE